MKGYIYQANSAVVKILRNKDDDYLVRNKYEQGKEGCLGGWTERVHPLVLDP